MKCELCHKADAACAITREKNGEEEELYVCKACAKTERQRVQANRQRTRVQSTSEDSGDGPQAIFGELVSALESLAGHIEEHLSATEKAKADEPKMTRLPTERIAAPYRIRGLLHLEGLHLLGEIEAVHRATRALRMELRPVDADGVYDVAHAYEVYHDGSVERAKRVVQDILREESNARTRLIREMPRVLGDAMCRSLAILKNCRLLSSGELVDLLSPIRLGLLFGYVEGITRKEVEDLMAVQDLTNSEDNLNQEERDRLDAERADELNKRFEGVLLNDIV